MKSSLQRVNVWPDAPTLSNKALDMIWEYYSQTRDKTEDAKQELWMRVHREDYDFALWLLDLVDAYSRVFEINLYGRNQYRTNKFRLRHMVARGNVICLMASAGPIYQPEAVHTHEYVLRSLDRYTLDVGA